MKNGLFKLTLRFTNIKIAHSITFTMKWLFKKPLLVTNLLLSYMDVYGICQVGKFKVR